MVAATLPKSRPPFDNDIKIYRNPAGIRYIVIFAPLFPLYDIFHATINLDYALLDRLVIVIINECRKSSEYCKLCVLRFVFSRLG